MKLKMTKWRVIAMIILIIVSTISGAPIPEQYWPTSFQDVLVNKVRSLYPRVQPKVCHYDIPGIKPGGCYGE